MLHLNDTVILSISIVGAVIPIIKVIVGRLIDKVKKLTSEEIKKTTKVKSKLNVPAPPGEEDTIIKLGLKTNQTLDD